MQLTDFCTRLNERLRHVEYAAVDPSQNGMQVGGDGVVEHAAFAVDAAVETIERAAAANADVLVTHHGIVWGSIDRVTGQTYRRIALLIEHDLALYVSHLPLDGHDQLGNAAGIADVLGLADRESFGSTGDITIGLRGRLDEPVSVNELERRLTVEFDAGDGGVRTFAFGPESVQDVAIVTGSGVDWVEEAIDAGVDVFVTGEGKHQVYHEAKEGGVNVVLGGHYATETFGVRALESLVAEWGVETTFIDCPTGL